MRRLACLLSVLLLALGCASGGGKPAPDLVAREDRYFLVSPLEGYPLSVGSDVRMQLERAHHDLLEEGDRRGVETTVNKLQQRNPELAPATVLAAQADFVVGLHRQVIEELDPVVAKHPDYVAAQLLYGRSSEKLGALSESLEAYESIAAASPLAESRRLDLAPRVTEEMGQRIEDALAKGHLAAAREELEKLETWAPDHETTIEMAARVAAATGDEAAELAALRRLSRLQPGDEATIQRLAELELQLGDPAVGMRLIEELAAKYPDYPEIQEELAQARFLWRLQLLPPEVRRLAEQPELTRGDFAVMVYWLFPEVRYGRSGGAKIANDILDHPQREALVRIINAGVMEVDSSLHRFEPYRALQRLEAISAMLELVARKQPPPACLESGRVPSSRQGICAAAGACGLIDNQSDCLPAGTVDGQSALDLTRSAQELKGAD